MNINTIVPFSMLDSHDLLIREFFHRGFSKIFNHNRILCAKNSKGFAIPISIKINFGYNHKFGYSFIGVIEKLESMSLFMDDINKLPV